MLQCNSDMENLNILSCIQWWDDELNQKAAEVITLLQKRYNFLGIGRNRVVFDMGNGWVIKFPLCHNGLADNDYESSIVGYSGDWIVYPNTKGVTVKGFLCCCMEKLTPTTKSYNELPDWVGFVDCGQVGYNKQGALCAYDYGIR